MPAGRGLDLDAGEHRYLLAHHVRGDRDSPVADQVGAAFAEAKLHRAAVLVAERAGVIAEEPGIAGCCRLCGCVAGWIAQMPCRLASLAW
jgi:hypothetical protein